MKNANVIARVLPFLAQAPRVAGLVALSALMPLSLAGGATLGHGLMAGAAQAQNLFKPRLYVNNEVITEFEIEQRARFLQILNAPGDLEKEALKALIDDRLRMNEARRFDFELEEAQVKAGMEEFAGRAQLTADQLIAELAKAGVSAETFRDFVIAGATWREVMRGRFGGKVSVSDIEIDQFIESQLRPRALKVQVSELVIPVPEGQEAEALAFATGLSKELKGVAAFSQAAREYSAAPTAENGGQIAEWLALSDLPPQISGQLAALQPGGVSQPMVVPGAIVLFQLRDLARDERAPAPTAQVEYAELWAQSDSLVIATIRRDADNCNDLYAYAQDLPDDQLKIQTATPAGLAQDVALQLARLDLGEIAVEPRGDGRSRVLMLCKRQPQSDTPINRDQVKEQVINQKIEGIAANYLEELRHAAIIREK